MLFLSFNALSSKEEGRMRYLFLLQEKTHPTRNLQSSQLDCGLQYSIVTLEEVAQEARVFTEIEVAPGE
jgi:hypothetical protein